MTDKKKKVNEKESSEPLPDPFCDWNGGCGKKAYAEVYPIDSRATYHEGYPIFKHKGWSYLCFKHFIYATIRGDPLVWCEVCIEDTTRLQRVIVDALGLLVRFYGGIRKIRYFLESVNKLDDINSTNEIAKKMNIKWLNLKKRLSYIN